MSPEVLARKLERLTTYLSALEAHRGRTAAEIRADPYEVERLLELLVQVAVDMVAHLLAEEELTPSSYRDAFAAAGREGMISDDLAGRLADAAGLRNVLVHLYEDIDYEIVAVSIGKALQDFAELLQVFQRRLDEEHAARSESDGSSLDVNHDG